MYIEKLHGPPGTGKTYALIERVRGEIDRGMAPEDIGYYSFTRAAAREASRRISIDGQFPHFRTIHSECFKLLGLARDDVIAGAKLHSFAQAFGYEISDLSEDQDIAEHEVREKVLRTLGDYLLFFEEWRKNLLLDTEQAYRSFMRMEDLPLGWSLPVVVKFQERYEAYKRDNGLYDFADMLLGVLRQGATPRVRVIVLDEAQDCSPLQFKVIDLWLGGVARHYIAGDPFQCMPPGTKIGTSWGEVPIENIGLFDKVVCGLGDGKIGEGFAVAVGERDYDGDLIKVKLASGKELLATSEHKFFWNWPASGGTGFWYIYLMNKGTYWRLGKTNNPLVRLRCEATIDGMLPIAAFKTEVEALEAETIYSLRYGIPTTVFQYRYRQTLPKESQERIFKETNSAEGAERLLRDLRKEWAGVLYHQGSVQGTVARRWVNIEALFRDHDRPRKIVYWQTEGNRGALHFQSLERARRAAHFKAKELGAGVVERWGFLKGKQASRFLLVPACNLLPGCFLPILKDGAATMEQVVAVEKVPYKGKVHNLEVEPTNNYCAESIFVSNCIYEWQGARPELFEARQADQRTLLDQSFRLPRKVYELSRQIIAGTPAYRPRDAEGYIKRVPAQRALEAVEQIDGSAFILVRNRYLLTSLVEELYLRGVPFGNLRGPSPFRGEIAGRVLLLRRFLRNEPLAVANLTHLLEHIPQKPYLTRGLKAEIKRRAQESPGALVRLPSLLGQVTEAFTRLAGSDEYMDLLKMTPQYRSYFGRVIAKHGEAALTDRPKILLGTIHSAKGMEAAHVIILPDMAKRTWLGWTADPAAEGRVWYVAVTRAKQGVTLVDAQQMRSFQWPQSNR